MRSELINNNRAKAPVRKRILIYGAGSGGVNLLREIREHSSWGVAVVGFLDDNRTNKGTDILGTRVLGCGRDAASIIALLRKRGVSVDEIVVAMPSANRSEMREALANARATGLPCKTLPALNELISDKVLSAQIRPVAITDLLGREPIVLEESKIRSSLRGQAVLVTGGAGSIGSELCRQLANFDISKLVILDKAESDLFRIEMELKERFSAEIIVPEIGDMCDSVRVTEILHKHSISTIFHAAAYKHVPMMEQQPIVAIANNVLGTHTLAQAAIRCQVKSFLMISSDKAVNPTNVMGATKRVAELVVSSIRSRSTKFVSVRFGNVLASNGSVVTIFQRQIERGGPVTVTHPDICRYFMTIPEAVGLVLQASTMGKGSEIFVLDMGQMVRIVDLAESMIELSGLVPHKDIEIRVTGLRPGEKLYEELAEAGEAIIPTYHEKIKIFKGAVPEPGLISSWLSEVQEAIGNRDAHRTVLLLKELVPEYQPSALWTERISDPRVCFASTVHAQSA